MNVFEERGMKSCAAEDDAATRSLTDCATDADMMWQDYNVLRQIVTTFTLHRDVTTVSESTRAQDDVLNMVMGK